MKTTVMNNNMKSISLRLPKDDVELFQLICQDYGLTRSEATRILIQSFISQTIGRDKQKNHVHNQYEVQDISALQKIKEVQRFYENFKLMNKRRKPGKTFNEPRIELSHK